MTSRWAVPLPACLVAALCAVLAQPAHAQEVGVYYSAARSGLAELDAPGGFGGYLRLVPRRHASLRVSYHRHVESARRRGDICNNYVAQFRCLPEEIATRTTVHGGAATTAWSYLPAAWLEFELGAGVSLNDVRGSERTESGRPSSLVTQMGGQVGGLAIANLRFRPLRAVPLTVEAGLARHYLRLTGCAEAPRAYAPYCGGTNLRELRIGVGYLLH